ncbi:response regulator [bacterium]|nr:response regulator [bacterium]
MSMLTILCVDDQREVLAALKKDLAFFEETCDIIDCESAAEAWEQAQAVKDSGGHLFLVVCDHIMPGENGVDFLARLTREEDFHHMKKILLTGLADQQDTIRAINEAHVDLYVEKPWESDALITSIRDLLADYIKITGMDPAPFHLYFD